MNDMSAPLSIRPDCPIDGIRLAVLCGVRDACHAIGVDYLVAGATARDLLLHHVYGHGIRRRTEDIDIGIAVPDWDAFQRLKDALTEQPGFQLQDTAHALFYSAVPGGEPLRIDVIPFDGVEDPDGRILWPPSGDTMLSVRGYRAALAEAVEIQLPAAGIVRSASLPGLALLKLFAWLDRGRLAPVAKDALDLVAIVAGYADAGQEDRLYAEREELLEMCAFDVPLAGALLLADDVKSITPAPLLDSLRQELGERSALDRLLDQITLRERLAGRGPDEIVEARQLRHFWGRLFGVPAEPTP